MILAAIADGVDDGDEKIEELKRNPHPGRWFRVKFKDQDDYLLVMATNESRKEGLAIGIKN